MAETKGESSSPIGEISHGPSAFEQFLDKNQKLLVLIAILIAVGTAGWVVQRGVREGVETAAGAALVDAGDVAALQSLIDEHGGTPAAVSAGLLLADRQWDDGQQDAALATLNGLINEHPNHPAAGPARARLGSRLAQQGKFDEAKPVLQALTQGSGADYLAPYALITLAQIAKAEGDLERAGELLEQSANYPNNFFSQATTNQRRFLDFEMPEEIDPPPLPEILEGDDATGSTSGGSGNPLIDVLGGGEAPAATSEPVRIPAADGAAGDDAEPSAGEAGEAGDDTAEESGELAEDSGDDSTDDSGD